jgi:predicted RecB family nuclease
MPDPHILTAPIFTGYLQCKTKGRLLSRSADVEAIDIFDPIRERLKLQSEARVHTATGRTIIPFEQISNAGAQLHLVDFDTTYIDLTQLDQPQNSSKRSSSTEHPFIPILFASYEPPQAWHKTLLCFSAIAIRQSFGIHPAIGYIRSGTAPSLATLRLTNAIEKKTVEIAREAHRIITSTNDVPLMLNKHCKICQFRQRCRRIAIETDNLSLIGTLGEKERRKLLEKGITTITQLSYGYRPRRKRRVRATAPPKPTAISAKNDNKLRALALKKNQIHVVNARSPMREGHPVYLDVEGLPGDDFFYLIGMRYTVCGDWIECSLWANTREEERRIWAECLQRLTTLQSPQIVHYGHYERRFLRQMKERYPDILPSATYVDDLLASASNALAPIFGSIYFPTYSNGLKDVANYLGFQWTEADAFGALASLWRLYWELTSDEDTRLKICRYNMEDCRAVEVVATAIDRICQDSRCGSAGLNCVDVSSLEIPYQRTFGKFSGVLPEFQKINEAAYWDYQRQRVYVRLGAKVQGAAESQAKVRRSRVRRPDKVLWVEGIVPAACRKCKSRMIWKAGCQSQTVADLIISRKGIRRQITKYAIQRYRCGVCRTEMGVPRQNTSYGLSLRAYIIYLLIEARVSHKSISDHLKTLFDLVISPSRINDIKCFVANEYEALYRTILQSISSGNLVHVDETKGVVYGGGHYVWIFTNLTTVAYVYSPTRESDVLRSVLNGFSGVLVSDFYSAYDTFECQQQKCLIHLMRDINETLLKSPFNAELSYVASRFGALLRSIVGTIDRWGLKSHHMRKHKRDVDKFFADIEDYTCSSEAALGLKKRLLKNRGRLFTFLDFDGVPWNNNNAEHAVRAFTRLRNTMATSTVKGTKEYAILLSVQQTLKYRNLDFLGFITLWAKNNQRLG